MKQDINDVLRTEGEEGVRARLAGAKTYNGKSHTSQDEDAKSMSVPNFAAWKERDIPPADLLCGTWLSTTSRVIITGPTGLGKTMLGVAIAFAISTESPLLHWEAGRRARVLYVDGEMSRREMKRRLMDEGRRCELEPEDLFVLSREDFDDMPPLNTEDGQKWMDAKLDEVKPDLVILDNIQSLVAGDQTKEESWSPVLPWVASLTKRHIGQIWFHHTGHNEGHSYGTSTRAWRMDTTILMRRVDADTEHLTFTLEFTKARERTPANRAEFDTVTISLIDDEWKLVGPVTGKRKVPDSAKVGLGLLKRAITQEGAPAPATNGHIPLQARCVTLSLWRKYVRQGTVQVEDDSEKARSAERVAFHRISKRLQELGLIEVWGDYVWVAE